MSRKKLDAAGAAIVVALVSIAPIRVYAIDSSSRADSLLGATHNWHGLHRAFAELRESDDGEIAEGISDFVVRRLATHWGSLPELATIVRADTAFESWIVRHIDATTDEHDLASIVRHASVVGPRNRLLRRRILGAARAALEDVRHYTAPEKH